MIVRGGKLDPKKKAEGALRATDTMERLIGDLIDIARIESVEFSVDVDTWDAGELVMEATDAMQAVAAHNSVTLDAVLPSEPVLVRCDRDRFRQVLLNIVGRTLKFTPAGGAVVVGVQAGAHEAVFGVSDSGPELSPDDIRHVFERYWQAAQARAREGVGLGLFISKKVVEAQHGRIWVESEPGSGATFRFALPLAPRVRYAEHTSAAAPP